MAFNSKVETILPGKTRNGFLKHDNSEQKDLYNDKKT